MNKLNLLFALIITSVSFSQINSSKAFIVFDQLTINTTANASVYLSNTGNRTVYINKVYHSSGLFSVSDSVFSIGSHDSVEVTITYKPKENIYNDDVITFMNDDSTAAVSIKVKGSGKYNDLYDAITFNLFDSQLKTALTIYTSNHTSLGYNLARDKMFETVDDYGYDTIECVYIGRKIKAVNRTEAQNLGFNTEHTWPQSNFSQSEPMRSDLYHLYPTDNAPNNARSNYPFGMVVSNITYNNGGSKLGTDATGAIVFEPRDVHKGNVARSMFYFITRYPVNYGGFFTAAQETVMRQWNHFDTVDTHEMLRNDRIASFQMKRNPFIDHPEFVDRIYSFLTNASHPLNAALDIYPFYGSFDSTIVRDSSYKTVYLVNNGNADLVIDSITVNNMIFHVNNTVDTLHNHSFASLDISFIPDSLLSYEGQLNVYTSLGPKHIILKGTGKNGSVTHVKNESYVSGYSLMQNYPNPFNPSTNISFMLPKEEHVTLKLYDILGNEIGMLFNGMGKSGRNNVYYNGAGLSSGIYIYLLKADNYTSSKVMTLIK